MSVLPEPIAALCKKVDRSLDTLETPAVLIDVDIADANLRRWQQQCNRQGLANRPHIKTHRSIGWALRQLELGAKGITVQTLGEAEVMAGAGITDIFITRGILGPAKLSRLAELARSVSIAVVADSPEIVAAMAQTAQNLPAPLRVFVECDTGAARCGIADPASVAGLAALIEKTPKLEFGGLMTYPPAFRRTEATASLTKAIEACRLAGIEVPVVSTGGSPDMWLTEGLESVTEYRAGTYIFNDRSLVACGSATPEDCAMTVLATVISRPAPGRAILDAGSKALTSDLMRQESYGFLPDYPQARIYQLNEEHGLVDVSRCDLAPVVGERVRIIPNHTCVVSNMFDQTYLVQGGKLIGALPVEARGLSA